MRKSNLKINTKPATKAATTAKPAGESTERQAANAQRRDTIKAARIVAAAVYNGPSLSVHASFRNGKLAEYLDRVNTPKQRAGSETDRDTSALAVAFKHCDAKHTFNPCDYGADLGAISRLASLNYLRVAGDRIALTDTGLARAKAAKPATVAAKA